MDQRYKITFEIDTTYDGQKEELKLYLFKMIKDAFKTLPENMRTERVLSKAERIILGGTCIDSQAEDQYCEKCPGGCIECQKRWLRQLGWEERELPEKPFLLFGRKED